MLYDTDNLTADLANSPAALDGPLPVGWVLGERCVAALRAHLREAGRGDHRIYFCRGQEFWDIDRYLDPLNAPAGWTPIPGALGGEALSTLSCKPCSHRTRESGFLYLPRYQVTIARWYAVDCEGYGENYAVRSLWLLAAPSAERIAQLHGDLIALRRGRGAAMWQITGDGWSFDRAPRSGTEDDLVLVPSLRDRVVGDAVRFFSEATIKLYQDMRVPHRRGLLLYGPPGNGKTSLIRHIGALLSDVPMLLLRPSATFDQDGLQNLLEQWKTQAPAILVIEDLDWILEKINVSTFLNLLDGVDSFASGGLLLIATTNHPEKLDPAINNRPGRFDVVVELPNPGAEQRTAFLTARLPDIDAELVTELVRQTDGLSFAHLQELLRLSGLLAIEAQRPQRSAEDLRSALGIVTGAHQDATHGFPASRPEVRFGLAYMRDCARQDQGPPVIPSLRCRAGPSPGHAPTVR